MHLVKKRRKTNQQQENFMFYILHREKRREKRTTQVRYCMSAAHCRLWFCSLLNTNYCVYCTHTQMNTSIPLHFHQTFIFTSFALAHKYTNACTHTQFSHTQMHIIPFASIISLPIVKWKVNKLPTFFFLIYKCLFSYFFCIFTLLDSYSFWPVSLCVLTLSLS